MSIPSFSIGCVASSKYPLCSTGGEIVIDKPIIFNKSVTVIAPPGFTGKSVTVIGNADITGVVDPIEMILTEQASIPQTTDVGEGALWVRNDAPNVLIYTDDVGTDFVIGGGGATTTLASTGGTESLVVDGVGPALSVKGLTAGTNITLVPSASDITINGPTVPIAVSGNWSPMFTIVDGFSALPIVRAGTQPTYTRVGNIVTLRISISGGTITNFVPRMSISNFPINADITNDYNGYAVMHEPLNPVGFGMVAYAVFNLPAITSCRADFRNPLGAATFGFGDICIVYQAA